MKMKNFKLKEEYELLIAFVSLVLLILFFGSCNPVRKVLTNPYKFAIVKDSVIKRGYCKCDTSFLYITDTLTTVDTLTEIYVDTISIKDTTILWETKFNTITKIRTIRDSIKMVMVDTALAGVLRKELAIEKQISKENKSWKKMFFMTAASAIGFFLLLFKLK
jgi:hypothetical protein